jgi:tetratricopeptide (TPR) repeat protein
MNESPLEGKFQRGVTLCGALLMVVIGLFGLLGTSGCASRWTPPNTERAASNAPAANTPVSPAPAARPTALAEFEARHRDAADNAGQTGRWAEVIWSLDVLQALRPDDSSLPARRLQAEQAAQALASDRLRQAKAAQQRGDAEAAQRHYLEVLALQPAATTPADALQAADGLRHLERERVVRQHLGIPARSTFTRAPLAANRSNGKVGATGRNDVEHASMLAAQGDVSGAISLLKPVAATGNNDAGARRLLGDLYRRQAEALWPQQRDNAITAAESGLQADPTNKALRERLLLWKAEPVMSKAAAPPSSSSSAPASAAPAAKASIRPATQAPVAASKPATDATAQATAQTTGQATDSVNKATIKSATPVSR